MLLLPRKVCIVYLTKSDSLIRWLNIWFLRARVTFVCVSRCQERHVRSIIVNQYSRRNIGISRRKQALKEVMTLYRSNLFFTSHYF